MRILVVALLVVCLKASAQLAVQVDDEAVVQLSQADMAKLPRHKAMLHDHGKVVNYEGVLLHDVLTSAKFDYGKGLHGKQLSSFVLAKAKDGYQVVFALAETDPTMCDCDLIVADKRDDQPLAESEGPLRVVVPHDKRPARSIRMLTGISVRQTRD